MFRSVLAVLLSTAAVISAQPNIVEVAVVNGFSTLVAAVNAADPSIAAALTSAGPFSK
jgi:hypothetical protein